MTTSAMAATTLPRAILTGASATEPDPRDPVRWYDDYGNPIDYALLQSLDRAPRPPSGRARRERLLARRRAHGCPWCGRPAPTRARLAPPG